MFCVEYAVHQSDRASTVFIYKIDENQKEHCALIRCDAIASGQPLLTTNNIPHSIYTFLDDSTIRAVVENDAE